MAAVQEPLEIPGGPAKGTAMAKVGINGQGRHLLERIHTDGDGSTVFNGDRKRGAESPEEVNPAKVARLQIEALERHQEVMNQTLDACTDPRKAQPLPVPSDMNNTDSSMESSSETVATTEKGANSTETSATNNAISTDCDMAETPTEQTSIKDPVSASSPTPNGVQDTSQPATMDSTPPDKSPPHSTSQPSTTALPTPAAKPDCDASPAECSTVEDAVLVPNGEKASFPEEGEGGSADSADRPSADTSEGTADTSAADKEPCPVRNKEEDLLISAADRSRDMEDVESLDSEGERDLLEGKSEPEVATKHSENKAAEEHVIDWASKESSPEVIELISDEPVTTSSSMSSTPVAIDESAEKAEAKKESQVAKSEPASSASPAANTAEIHQPLKGVEVQPDVIELDDSLDDLETDLPASQESRMEEVLEEAEVMSSSPAPVKQSSEPVPTKPSTAASPAPGSTASSPKAQEERPTEAASLPPSKQETEVASPVVTETTVVVSSPKPVLTETGSQPSASEEAPISVEPEKQASSEVKNSNDADTDMPESAPVTVDLDQDQSNSACAVSDEPSEMVTDSSDPVKSPQIAAQSPPSCSSPKPDQVADSVDNKATDLSEPSPVDSSNPPEAGQKTPEPKATKESDSVSEQELPKSDSVSEQELPKSDSVSEQELPKSDFASKEELPKSDSISKEELPKSDSTSIEELPKSDSTSIEELPKSDSTSMEELPKSDSASKEDLSKSDSTSKQELPKSDSASKQELPKSDSASKQELPKSDSASKQELPKSDSASKQELPKSDSASKQELPKSDSAAKQELPKSDSASKQELPKSDSASKQKLPKSQTTDVSKLSSPAMTESAKRSSAAVTESATDDTAVMIIDDDDDDDDVQISKVEEKSEGHVTPRPSSVPSCRSSSPRSPRSSAASPAKATSPAAAVPMEVEDEVQVVTEEEFKTGESTVTLTKKSLELLVKKRMIAMFRASQTGVVTRLHTRIQDLQQEVDKWRNTAKDLERQMKEVSEKQHAARMQRRQAKVSCRNMSIQVSDAKIEAVAQQQQAQEAQNAAGKASRASPIAASPTSPGRSMPPGGVALVSGVNTPAGQIRGMAPGARAPTVRSLIDQQRGTGVVSSPGRGAPRAPVRPVGGVQPGAAPRPGGAGVIDLTDDDDAAKATAPGSVLRGVVPNMMGQQLVRAGGTPIAGIRPGTLLLQPTSSGAPVLVQPMRSQGPGTYVLTRPSGSAVVASHGGLRPMEASGVRVTNPQLVTLGRPGAMSSMRLTAPITVTTTANALRHPAPLPPPPIQQALMGLPKQPPLKPGLKISRVQQGIVLSWNMTVTEALAAIANYQLFAYQEGNAPPNTNLWKKVGDVKALPLPMACTLTQFQEGNKYHFAVRAVDCHGRIGPFSDPSSIHLVPQNS